MVDYKKIKLANERSGQVQKRLNRNGAWKFFKILYRDSMGKVFLLNLLLLLFVIPTVLVVYFLVMSKTYALTTMLPTTNYLGVGSGVWLDVGRYAAEQTAIINKNGNLWAALAALLVAFAFSGGFAVIRDSFWTGKLVIWKPFFRGIGQTLGYTLLGTAALSGAYLGIFFLGEALKPILATWVYVIALIAAWVLFALIFMYVYTLFAVAATYKQPVADNLADAWRLMWLNFLPNLIRIVITALPFVLYVLIAQSAGMIASLLLAAMFMFGMFYVVFVYMVHMMRTFALFHPVEPKKAKQ